MAFLESKEADEPLVDLEEEFSGENIIGSEFSGDRSSKGPSGFDKNVIFENKDEIIELSEEEDGVGD